MRFRDIRLSGEHFTGQDNGYAFSARWPLFLIREAWRQGCEFEDLADGFGAGEGTHRDWSGIRDSSEEAITAMTERAFNFLFGQKGY